MRTRGLSGLDALVALRPGCAGAAADSRAGSPLHRRPRAPSRAARSGLASVAGIHLGTLVHVAAAAGGTVGADRRVCRSPSASSSTPVPPTSSTSASGSCSTATATDEARSRAEPLRRAFCARARRQRPQSEDGALLPRASCRSSSTPTAAVCGRRRSCSVSSSSGSGSSATPSTRSRPARSAA